MPQRPVREVFPVGPQKVRLEVPSKPRAARLYVAGRAIPSNVDASAIELEVPAIDLHEMVAVDL